MFAGLIACAALLLTLNPLGYFGGHWDDGRYLEAALQGGIGTDHWALRWPVVGPAALAVRVFGLSHTSLMVPGMLTLAAVLTVNFWAARQAFGTAVATVACFALLSTPEVTRAATRLTADLPELLFWSAALWAWWFGRAGSARWLLVAGALAGCAWATRETGLGLLLVLAGMFVAGVGPPRRSYGWIAAGFVAVWLPEQLALYAATGDPLYRIHVDLRHVEIPSNDLAGGTAHGTSAPLSTSLMRRWSGAGPLRLNWAVDPWLNLFANVAYGFDFLLATVALWWVRSRPKLTWLVVTVVVANVVTVVYLIATDPKPRMFMPATGAACLLFAVAAVALWPAKRAVVTLAATVKLLVAAAVMDVATSYAELEPLARRALAHAAGPVAVDRWTASSLALAPADVRARLTPNLAPHALTAGKLADYTGTDAPPPGRWRMVWRGHSVRLPLTWRVAHALGFASAPYPALYVTLYRAAGPAL